MAGAKIKKKPVAKVAKAKPAKKVAPAKIAKKAAPKPVKKVAPAKIAKKAAPVKKIAPIKAAPAAKIAKPPKAAKPAKVAAPAKKIEVAKDKKVKIKEEKILKTKGKKGAALEEDTPRKTSSSDDDDDLFEDKKGGKAKFSGERLKKDAEPDAPVEKILNLSDFFQWSEIQAKLETLEYFLPKDDACMERLCENIRTSGPYCRLHYIAKWKLMQQKKEILKEGKLQALVEEFISKYPFTYVNALIDDLDSDREFNRVLTELNISDTEFEVEEVAAVEDEAGDDFDLESRGIDTFKPGFEEE